MTKSVKASKSAAPVYVPKRHILKKKTGQVVDVIRNSSVKRCMIAAGCTLIPDTTKVYLKTVALNHLRNILRDAMILCDHDGNSTLSMRHLKLALALKGFTMLGHTVSKKGKKSANTSSAQLHQ